MNNNTIYNLSVLKNSARNGCDCTNGGISSKFVELFASKNIDPDTDLLIVDGTNGRTRLLNPSISKEYKAHQYIKAVPQRLVDGVDVNGNVIMRSHVMMGGNFVYTSDSRYREEVCAYPIPIHDRVE